MTNDAFDDRYYEFYDPSDDQAINAIATYCYGLYSSDLLLPIRLRGRYALDRETRKTIARCVLFLRSGNEYQWPPLPDNTVDRCVAGLAFWIGFPTAVALTLIATVMAIFDPEPLEFQILAIALPLTALCAWFGFLRPTVPSDAWERYTESGDYDCWPFHQVDSFDASRRRDHLLGR